MRLGEGKVRNGRKTIKIAVVVSSAEQMARLDTAAGECLRVVSLMIVGFGDLPALLREPCWKLVVIRPPKKPLKIRPRRPIHAVLSSATPWTLMDLMAGSRPANHVRRRCKSSDQLVRADSHSMWFGNVAEQHAPP